MSGPLKLCRPAPVEGQNEASWKWENLGQLTIGVAHDFNNLLASISGYAELILASGEGGRMDAGRAREFAKHILAAAGVGQAAIKELQWLVRPGKSENEAVDIHEILRNTVTITRAAMGCAVTVSIETAPRPAWIPGCKGLLHNVFLNLFLNARDAMPEGGHLSVGTAFQDGGWSVSVKDTGSGMSEEVRRGIFRPFYTTKGVKGTGLGLANVRSTMERHGGRIEVESSPGRGTEFRLWFPAMGREMGATA